MLRPQKNQSQVHPSFSVKRENCLFAVCLALSFVFFFVDLLIPWAIVGILYVTIIILSFWSHGEKLTLTFAVLSSTLLITAFFLMPPQTQVLRILTNHFLVLVIIWTAAVLGLQYKKLQESRAYFSMIINSSDDAIYGRDLDGKVTSWNNGAEAVFGYAAPEILGRPVTALLPEEKIDEGSRLLEKIKAGERIQHYETVRMRKDGRRVHVSLTISPILDKDGMIIGVSTISRDISQRVLAEQKERRLWEQVELEKMKLEEVLAIEEHINTIFNQDKLVDFIVQKTLRILDARHCSLLFLDEQSGALCLKGAAGTDEGRLQDSPYAQTERVAAFVARERKPVLVEDMANDPRFAGGGTAAEVIQSFSAAPIMLGERLLGILTVADKLTPEEKIFSELDMRVLCIIAHQVAIALENAKLYKELKYLTVTDSLTQMFNYRHFITKLDDEIKRFSRNAGPFSLLMFDVDDFKTYNDSFGHLEGDRLLQELGQVLNASIRETDVACRYAGDEFVVILISTDRKQAVKVAEKIKVKVGSMPLKRKVTLSMGVVEYQRGTSRYDFILKADTALYEAKKKGKDCFVVL